MKTESCTFCQREKLNARTFYDFGGWFAFLAAPEMVKGHAILAAIPQPLVVQLK